MNILLARAIDAMAGRRVYIDSCVFIFFLERNPVYFEIVSNIMQAFSEQRIFGFTGHAAIAEVMVHPYRKGDALAIAQTKQFFERPQFLTQLDHPSERFDAAANISAQHRLKLLDALHFATAIDAQCDFILTNDFKFKSNELISVMQLDDLLTS